MMFQSISGLICEIVKIQTEINNPHRGEEPLSIHHARLNKLAGLEDELITKIKERIIR